MKLTDLTLVALAVALGACTDGPLQPIAARVPNANAAVSAGPSKSVVEFNGPVRKDFAERVAALGGTVDFVSDAVGFAAVSGLTPDAAAALAKLGGIGSIYDDVTVQLGSPTSIGAMSAADVSATSIANPAASFRFSFQWNMRAIAANTAWAAGNLGAANVTAAILDSGIDYDSFDMNGMVDLARSTSLVASDNAFATSSMTSTGTGRTWRPRSRRMPRSSPA